MFAKVKKYIGFHKIDLVLGLSRSIADRVIASDSNSDNSSGVIFSVLLN